MANRTVSVALVADVGQYQAGMLKAATATRAVGDNATVAGARAQRGFDMAGKGALLLGGIAGGALTLGLKSAIDAASEAEQSIGGVQAVFKGYAQSVIADSKSADRALGLSANAYRELATVIGSQMKNAGVPMEELAGKTEGIIQVGADLAAQFGGSTQEAVQALSSAFRGELDPIERYGISLSAARVGAKAVEMGLAESATEISLNAKAMATLALITEQSADAQGAFAREADTAAGRAARAAAGWENLKVAVGDQLLPVWSALVDVLGTKVVPALGETIRVGSDVIGFILEHKDVALALAAVLAVQLAGGITAVTVAMNSMILTPAVLGLSSLLGVVLNLPGAFAAASTAVSGFLTAAAPLVAVGAVVWAVAKVVDFASAASDASQEVAGMWEAVADTRGVEQLEAVVGVVEQIEAKIRSLNEELPKTDGAMQGFLGPLGMLENGGTLNALDEYERQLAAANEKQIELTRTANTLGNQFGLNRDQVLDLAGKYNVDLSQGAENAYIEFQRFFTTEYGRGATEATVAVSNAFEDTKTAVDEAKTAVDQFKLSLDILTGAHVSMIQVESSLQAAVAEAKGAMEGMNGAVLDGAGNLNLQSESGRAAADVLLGVRDSGNQLISTMIQQGATSEEVRARDAQLRESFIQSAIQMGISRQAAEVLANQILGIPAERETTITADTNQATTAVAGLQGAIDGLRGRTVDILARAIMPDLNGSVSGSGRMGTYADGGWTGPGSKYQPAGIVHADEFVVPKHRVRALGGPSAVGSLVGMPGYAEGGSVAPVSIRAELNASAYDTQMNAFARQVIDKYEPVQGLIGALQFARSQVGRPYIWGGVGPAGYDCSGFMSAITNVARGRNPHSRVGSTASFPWGGFAGGYGSFTIGSTPNAGGGIGHMAGTLLGVNVESTGGVGVKVGGSARGAANGLFGTRAHLAMYGGGIIGEPVVGIGARSGNTYSFGERGPETVTPGIRSREFSGGGGAGGGGGTGGGLAGLRIAGTLDLGGGLEARIDGRIIGALTTAIDRGAHNP